jgi:DNA-binding transcriptional MerR regulator
MMRPAVARRSAPRASYPMRVVQRLTGLSPDTIRAWERRHGVVEPARSSGKTRHFSDEDVRRLILLRQAVERGHRIGSIANLSERDLVELVDQESALGSLGDDSLEADLEPKDLQYGALRKQYLDSIMRFDVMKASDLLSRAGVLLDRNAFLYQVVMPTLREIGNRWEAGKLSPAHEHLVSAQIRGLLDTLLRQHAPLPGAPKVIITTPPDEHHELGAATGALLAATRGFAAIYLGPNLPEPDIALAVKESRADLLVLGVQHGMTPGEVERFSQLLEHLSEHVETWIGLPPNHPAIYIVDEARYFVRFEDFDAALLERSERHVRTP